MYYIIYILYINVFYSFYMILDVLNDFRCFLIVFSRISTMLKLDKFQSNLTDQGCVSIAPTSSIRIWPPIFFSKIQKIRNPKNNRNRQPK